MNDDKFQGITNNELEKELKRRKIGNPPEPIDPVDLMDWSLVIESVKENIDCVRNDGWEMKGFANYLEEEVIKAVFGEDRTRKYYKWLKAAMDEH